jgi:hypothetical protein
VPLIIGLLLLILIPLTALILMPVGLVMRYRRGTARRPARGWVAGINVATLSFSVTIFLCTAAVAGIWVPRAFPYSGLGVLAGTVVGLIGLWLTRWEPSATALHYTPNRWLVLALTLLVASRMVYSVWRAWYVWHARPDQVAWIQAVGIPGSMAAGGLLMGYYLVYWVGVWRRAVRRR